MSNGVPCRYVKPTPGIKYGDKQLQLLLMLKFFSLEHQFFYMKHIDVCESGNAQNMNILFIM
jgi:hypothetical protein